MITDRQRERRKKYLGSSEAAAVCGLYPWANAYDVYLSKTTDLDPFSTPKTRQGELLEHALVEWGAEELGGGKVRHNVERVHPNKLFISHLDGLYQGRVNIEGKVHLNRYAEDQYGDDDTDEIPDYEIVQCQFAMMVCNLKASVLVVLLPERGLTKFRVERNDKLIAELYELWRDFMLNVRAKIAPVDMTPSLSTLQRVQRVPGKAVPVPVELIEALARARQAKKTAEAQEEAAKAAVLLAMGDAERGDGVEFLPKDDPCYLLGCDALENRMPTDRFVTAKLQTRTSIPGKELKRLAPDLYQQIAKVSESRVIRIGGCADAED